MIYFLVVINHVIEFVSDTKKIKHAFIAVLLHTVTVRLSVIEHNKDVDIQFSAPDAFL